MNNRRPASADFSRDSVVRYSVLHENEQLLASKYKRVLPSEDKQ